MDISFVFQLIVLVFSVVLHEVSHGYVAERLGDPTARNLGRLTLNPLKHIDPFGSIILPFLLSLIPGGIIIGWAKPVPYNPDNLRNPRRGAALIAAAGPLSNVAIAVVFSVIVRLVFAGALPWLASETFLELCGIAILINLSLAVLNLVPIPPLDGSKILAGFLPWRARALYEALERYQFVVLIAFLLFGLRFLGYVVSWLFSIFVGG